MISEAEGYANALLNRSQGDAEKFTAIVREYNRAPSVTKRRIYLETMEELFNEMENIIVIDPKVKGIVPIFGKGLMGEQK